MSNDYETDKPEPTVAPAVANYPYGTAQWESLPPTHPSFQDQLKFAASLHDNSSDGHAQSSDSVDVHFSVQRTNEELRLVPQPEIMFATPHKSRREHDTSLPSIRKEFTGLSTPLSVTTEYRPRQ
jgi:hypothetical protein